LRSIFIDVLPRLAVVAAVVSTADEDSIRVKEAGLVPTAPVFACRDQILYYPLADTTYCVAPVSSDKVAHLHLVGQRDFSLNIDIFWLTLCLRIFSAIPTQIRPKGEEKVLIKETK